MRSWDGKQKNARFNLFSDGPSCISTPWAQTEDIDYIATDGSWDPLSDTGGYAVCSLNRSFKSKIVGNQEINRSEAFACLDALIRVRHSCPLSIYIDSKNTIEGILKLVLNPPLAKSLWNKMHNFSILRTCAFVITELRLDQSLANFGNKIILHS